MAAPPGQAGGEPEGGSPALKVMVRWSGREFQVGLREDDTVAVLKRRIMEHTSVSEKRQKLLGLKVKGGHKGPLDDGLAVSALAIAPGQKIMMMGTKEEDISSANKQAQEAPLIQDDFDLKDGELQEVDVRDKEENQEKLRRRISSVDVKTLHPPRPGRKCLVLDIDYTLFDLGSSAERAHELARPHLHEFLAGVYEHYDLIIWSATSMKWVEVKMAELGVLSHPGYRITCMLDHQAMITVQTEKYGVFDCKPLAFIWAKFPGQYHEGNTVMLDDLRRNYVMNRQNGLVIRPFKRAHINRHTDNELARLKVYLCKIAKLDSLASLKHRKWEAYAAEELRQQQAGEAQQQQQHGGSGSGGHQGGGGAGSGAS